MGHIMTDVSLVRCLDVYQVFVKETWQQGRPPVKLAQAKICSSHRSTSGRRWHVRTPKPSITKTDMILVVKHDVGGGGESHTNGRFPPQFVNSPISKARHVF